MTIMIIIIIIIIIVVIMKNLCLTVPYLLMHTHKFKIVFVNFASRISSRKSTS
jgi:hypothetical protein